MSKKVNRKVPKLRFPEFEGDWEEKKLDELIQIKSGYAFSSNFFSAKETDKILLTPGNFHVNGSLYFGSNTKYYEGEVNEEYVLSNGDLLIVMTDLTKEMNILGNSIFLESKKTVIHNQRIGKILIKDNLLVTRRFLRDLLNLDTFKENIRQSATGSTVRHTSNKSLLSISTFLPSIAEQEKIAAQLGAVDTRLSQLRRKHELLQTYKRGVMQKLFSQQIRFKRDDGQPFPDWKEKKLGDIADTNQPHSFTGGPFGSDLKSSDYTPEGIRVIQLQNIGDGYFLNDYQIFTSEAKANQLISCNIYPNDILLSKMGDPVARACIVPNHHERYLMCSDGIRLAVNNKLFNTYFIYSFLNAPVFRKSAESASSGSTRKRIGLTTLRGLKLACPVLQEQEKIANFLTAIDKKIEAIAKQIDLTEQYKKGLLQKMFV